MAMFPCDFGRHRYQGPQGSVYANVQGRVSRLGAKGRVCPRHLAEYVEAINAPLQEVSEDGDSLASVDGQCGQCMGPVATSDDQAAFVTVYPPKGEPRTFYAPVCDSCREAVVAIVLPDCFRRG